MNHWGDVRQLVIEQTARGLLEQVMPGEDWTDEHHRETPRRFATMLEELTDSEDAAFKFTTFQSDSKEMVVVRDIPFYTLCAHHIIPFFGKCHIGYVPNGSIAGLSKFARTVKFWTRGLWSQEELTTKIAEFLEDNLTPQGVAVVMEAEHLCMTMRGVQVPGARTTTSAMRGVFIQDGNPARMEFFDLVRRA
jgi:GTP cyclohydrolase I